MGMQDHLNVVSINELKETKGGLNITGTLIKSFTSAANAVMDIGRSFGSALRRIFGRSLCSTK